MTREIVVVMRKELKEVGSEGSGGRRGRFTPLVGVAVAGILFPLNFGVRYVHAEVQIIMGLMLPVLFVLPIVADSFAGERERHTLETAQLRQQHFLNPSASEPHRQRRRTRADARGQVRRHEAGCDTA